VWFVYWFKTDRRQIVSILRESMLVTVPYRPIQYVRNAFMSQNYNMRHGT